MATPRDIRRLAFQTLYQLDARGGADAESILEHIAHDDEELGAFTAGERKKAFLLASGAYEKRGEADAFMHTLAPTWPAHRQAAVDRAILRLAYYEMTHAGVSPKIAVNEAVELAKMFSTEKSPAFVNGLLDKALKNVLKQRGETADERPGVDSGDASPTTPEPTHNAPTHQE